MYEAQTLTDDTQQIIPEDTISQDLLPIHSVKELQSKNQELITLLRIFSRQNSFDSQIPSLFDMSNLDTSSDFAVIVENEMVIIVAAFIIIIIFIFIVMNYSRASIIKY